MKRFALVLALLLALCLTGTALADQNFTFVEHRFTVFEGQTLTIELLRQGDALQGDVTWTSANQKVASVDANGVVTARSKGTTTVAAETKVNGRSYRTTATVEVQRPVTEITVNDKNLTVLEPDDPSLEGLLTLTYEDPEDERLRLPVLLLVAGSDTNLSATVSPRDASVTAVTVSADDDGELLRINGRTVTPKAPGECILTIASRSNPEVSVSYHVLAIRRVRGVTVTVDRKTIGVGDSAQASAAIQPDDASVKAVEWSTSTPNIISVSPDGTVTALSKGTGRVRATAVDGSNRYGEATVTVAQMPTGVSVKNPPEFLAVGRSVNLSATVTPNNANDKSVTWTTSDPSVARVNAGGQLTGVKRGTAVITCAAKADPSVYTVFMVTVTQPVTSITPNPRDVSVRMGETVQLGFTISPVDADNTSVSYSSNATRVATVDENGVVTGVSKGSAVITITANDGSNRTARVNVTVQQPVTGMTLRETSVTLITGHNKTLTPNITPSNANNKKVTWTTTDPSIATVDGNGRVTGVKAGVAVITCTSQDNPDVSAICTVTVIQRVTKINISPSTLEIRVPESATVSWTVEPLDATDKSVTFRSSNTKVATVDPDGTIHARARGECNITCKANDGSEKSARVHVVVIQPVQGVHMRSQEYTVNRDERVTITAVLEPENANNNHMTWQSSDTAIATVKGNTNRPSVRGMRWGDVVITGVTEDGGYTTSCTVHVGTYRKALEITDLYLQNNQIKMAVRNLSNMRIERFYFTVQVYDIYGQPIICTTDGLHYFTGYYLESLDEDEVTRHGRFHFDNFVQPGQTIGEVTFILTGYRCDDGFTYSYKVDERPFLTFESDSYVGPQSDDVPPDYGMDEPI